MLAKQLAINATITDRVPPRSVIERFYAVTAEKGSTFVACDILTLGVQLDIIATTVPGVTRIAEQVVHLVRLSICEAELRQRDVDVRVLPPLRVEI